MEEDGEGVDRHVGRPPTGGASRGEVSAPAHGRQFVERVHTERVGEQVLHAVAKVARLMVGVNKFLTSPQAGIRLAGGGEEGMVPAEKSFSKTRNFSRVRLALRQAICYRNPRD